MLQLNSYPSGVPTPVHTEKALLKLLQQRLCRTYYEFTYIIVHVPVLVNIYSVTLCFI